MTRLSQRYCPKFSRQPLADRNHIVLHGEPGIGNRCGNHAQSLNQPEWLHFCWQFSSIKINQSSAHYGRTYWTSSNQHLAALHPAGNSLCARATASHTTDTPSSEPLLTCSKVLGVSIALLPANVINILEPRGLALRLRPSQPDGRRTGPALLFGVLLCHLNYSCSLMVSPLSQAAVFDATGCVPRNKKKKNSR